MAKARLDTKLRSAFRTQQSNAERQSIPFLLTYEEWLAIWQRSGKLRERGKGYNKYCMARFNDAGPYAVGNVKIIKGRANLAEADWSKASARKSAALKGRAKTPEHRRAIGKATLGRVVSSDTRRKMSEAAKARCARMSPEQRKAKMKQVSANRKPKHSPETKLKLSAALKGRVPGFEGKHHSEETKARQRQTWRNQFTAGPGNKEVAT